MNSEKYDICILGGGIAGMTAGIYAARSNRKTILLETAITGGLANSTYIVENYPSHKKIHGMQLMQDVRDQVEELGVRIEEVVEILELDLTSSPKRITTSEGVFEADAVIVATGRKPIPLDVPTECAQVHHCAICDGAPYKGKRVLIVGGGNSAFDEGLYLKQLGVNHIEVIEVMDRLFAAQAAQDALFDSANGTCGVNCRLTTVCKDLVLDDDGNLKSAILQNKTTGETTSVDIDGIFVFLGQVPNTDMFKGVLDLDAKGYVQADPNMRTNIPGVFSAGDVNVKQFRQLTTAAADGTIAALMADTYLRKK